MTQTNPQIEAQNAMTLVEQLISMCEIPATVTNASEVAQWSRFTRNTFEEMKPMLQQIGRTIGQLATAANASGPSPASPPPQEGARFGAAPTQLPPVVIVSGVTHMPDGSPLTAREKAAWEMYVARSATPAANVTVPDVYNRVDGFFDGTANMRLGMAVTHPRR